jgi:hypothetical protein
MPSLTQKEYEELHKPVLEEGKKVLDYLRKRAEDPLFPILMGVFHSAGVPYEQNQEWVEYILAEREKLDILEKMGLQDRIDFLLTPKPPVTTKSASAPAGRAFLLSPAIRCYKEVCEPIPRSCTSQSTEESRDKLFGCLSRERRLEWEKLPPEKKKVIIAGFGKKITDLMREIMGDDDAVAVDTHVSRWLKDIVKIYNFRDPKTKRQLIERGEHGAEISDKAYKIAQEKIRKKAKEWGVTPAELQITAWLLGACSERNYGKLMIGRPVEEVVGERYEFDCDIIPDGLRLPSRRKKKR